MTLWWQLGKAVALVGALTSTGPASAEKRLALVVGNSAYVHSAPLANPVNDATDMTAALKEAGFEVITGLDLDKRAFDLKVRDFARALAQADVAIFYYAGHGLQVSGRNYLIAVDAQLASERDLDFEAVSVDFVLRQMELGRESKTNIVFLDACRDNPLSRSLARSMGTRSAALGQGLAQVQAGVGTFISYSTQPGNVALDGAARNSPFTAALAKSLREPGRTLTSVMVDVRREVLGVTSGKQVPWDHSALTGEFYFHTASAPGTAARTLPAPSGNQAATEERIRQLEEEVRRKSDPEQTAKLVSLAQYRERLRQLEEANRADQKRIGDVHMRSARSAGAPGAPTSGDISLEIGGIQMQIGRRVQEMRKLREDIAKLESELGVSVTTK
jgi:uncharacterized caspase-like protein